jgi:hypothetical protein
MEMIAQDSLFKQLSTTVYTSQQGQKKDRDIGVGQDWTSSKFQSVAQLKAHGAFINWHHAELFHKFGGLRNKSDFVKHTRKALIKYMNSKR